MLLIDEIDRADDEFEAFLLEFLADYQISIPERGTVKAASRRSWFSPPTARASCTRRCAGAASITGSPIPDPQREAEIIMLRAGDVAEATARAVVNAVQAFASCRWSRRRASPRRSNGRAARRSRRRHRRLAEALRRSIGQVLKDEEDLALVADKLDDFAGGRVRLTEG